MLYVLFFENKQGQLEYLLRDEEYNIEWVFDANKATKFEFVRDANRFKSEYCTYRKNDIGVAPIQA